MWHSWGRAFLAGTRLAVDVFAGRRAEVRSAQGANAHVAEKTRNTHKISRRSASLSDMPPSSSPTMASAPHTPIPSMAIITFVGRTMYNFPSNEKWLGIFPKEALCPCHSNSPNPRLGLEAQNPAHKDPAQATKKGNLVSLFLTPLCNGLEQHEP